MPLSFVVGTAADVFGTPLAEAVGAVLHTPEGGEPYRSEPVDASGWRALQSRVLRALDVAPQLTGVDAYQAVYVPSQESGIRHLAVGQLADPLQVGSLAGLLEELHRFAATASLPTDDVQLMERGAQYLEGEDPDADLDVQTYVQLMLSAKQAAARGQALWVVV
jgi:hypothetical protein